MMPKKLQPRFKFQKLPVAWKRGKKKKAKKTQTSWAGLNRVCESQWEKVYKMKVEKGSHWDGLALCLIWAAAWPWLQVLRFSRCRRVLNKAGFMCQLLRLHYEKRGRGVEQNCQCSNVVRAVKNTSCSHHFLIFLHELLIRVRSRAVAPPQSSLITDFMQNCIMQFWLSKARTLECYFAGWSEDDWKINVGQLETLIPFYSTH